MPTGGKTPSPHMPVYHSHTLYPPKLTNPNTKIIPLPLPPSHSSYDSRIIWTGCLLNPQNIPFPENHPQQPCWYTWLCPMATVNRPGSEHLTQAGPRLQNWAGGMPVLVSIVHLKGRPKLKDDLREVNRQIAKNNTTPKRIRQTSSLAPANVL